MPNAKVPYPYVVNGKLVAGNGSLIPICSLSNRSLLPSLTVSGIGILIWAAKNWGFSRGSVVRARCSCLGGLSQGEKNWLGAMVRIHKEFQ